MFDVAAANNQKRLIVMIGLFRSDFTNVSKDCMLGCNCIAYFELLMSSG